MPTNASVTDDTFATDDNENAATSTSVDNITLALSSKIATHQSSMATFDSPHSAAMSEESTPTSASSNPSLFAKLPGELRNRIYRAYFEESKSQREHTIDIKKAVPTFLNLLHTDRMIRSEAASIFFKEFLSIDRFFAAAPANMESALKSRIQSICALAAIHGTNLPLSITVQESLAGDAYYLPNMRSDFLGELMRFITNETNEWFARSTGSKQPEEGTHASCDQSVCPENMVHSSRRYRIERLHPNTASSQWSQWRSLAQQHNAAIAATNQHVHNQQLLSLQGAHQPIQRSADFLRVEVPLAELDWSKFERSVMGAYKRFQAPRWVPEGR